MDNTKETVNILSLCTGYGGFELALERIITRPMRVVAVEIEAYAAANLVAKAEQGKLAIEALYTDVKTFPSRKFRGCFDGIVAGYPCQPFSQAGKRQGTSDPRHLWPFIRKHIAAIRPVFCAFENVSGHVSLGFEQVYADLRALGYAVEAGLFTASEVGAPHKRERLFILAHSQHSRCRGRSLWESSRVQRQEFQQGKLERHEIRSETEGCSGNEELADTCCDRPQRKRPDGNRQGQAGLCSRKRLNQAQWPARPGQEQYEWEQPRTIESCMGRTVDGFRSRVDRLRLLGNGIVPDQAEKAIKYLITKLNKE